MGTFGRVVLSEPEPSLEYPQTIIRTNALCWSIHCSATSSTIGHILRNPLSWFSPPKLKCTFEKTAKIKHVASFPERKVSMWLDPDSNMRKPGSVSSRCPSVSAGQAEFNFVPCHWNPITIMSRSDMPGIVFSMYSFQHSHLFHLLYINISSVKSLWKISSGEPPCSRFAFVPGVPLNPSRRTKLPLAPHTTFCCPGPFNAARLYLWFTGI